MDNTSRSDGSLMDEIHFLTNLIQSHQRKQPGPPQVIHGPTKHNPTSHSKSRYTPYQVPSHTTRPGGGGRQSKERSRANNMVYRPPNLTRRSLHNSSLNHPSNSTPAPNSVQISAGPSVSVKTENGVAVFDPHIRIKTEPGFIKTEPLFESSISSGTNLLSHGAVDRKTRSVVLGSGSSGESKLTVTTTTRGDSVAAAPRRVAVTARRRVIDLEPEAPRKQAATVSPSVTPSSSVKGTNGGKGATEGGKGTGKGSASTGKGSAKKRRRSRRKKLKDHVPQGKPQTSTPSTHPSSVPPPSWPFHSPATPLLPYPGHTPTFPQHPSSGSSSQPVATPLAPPPPQASGSAKPVSKVKPTKRPKRSKLKWKQKDSTPAAATVPKKAARSKKAKNLQSKKGKDGLFKNKVWVPKTIPSQPRADPSQPPRTKPSRNKVWVPPRNQTEVIFLSPKPVSRVKPVPRDEPTQPPPLIGRETTTKQGNKQWVVSGSPPSRSAKPALRHSPQSGLGLVNPVKPVRLFGHEKKTKQGNKQWVVAGLIPRHFSRKSTRSRLKSSLVSFSGGRYTLDSSGKRLKRLSTSSQLAALSPAISNYIGGVARNSSARRIMASRVVKKSKAYVWHARMKKKQDRSKQFCLFFNRFGKCNKGDKCPYIHDPDKIAVCTKFLKGACDKMNGTCPFSHKISKEKMPVCSFFLRGVCTKEDCPYLHVSVGRDAEVCPDFLKGYCLRGEKCTMQHTLDCPKFSRTGLCPEGAKCPLRHSKKPKELPTLGLVKEPRAFKKARFRQEEVTGGRVPEVKGQDEAGGECSEEAKDGTITIRELDFMPLELNAAPDFIPL